MERAYINKIGACGGASSILIYETPMRGRWHGASVMHGSFTRNDADPDDQRIEVVELNLPGLDILVRAADVRPELSALLEANQAWRAAKLSVDLQPARHQAFTVLQESVFRVAASEITVAHFEQIAKEAYADGLHKGAEDMRGDFRALLGIS